MTDHMTSQNYYNSFVEKLRLLKKRELTVLSVSRIMQFLVFFGTVVLFCALIESIMWLSSQNRLVLFGIIVVSGAAILVYCGFVPILCWLGRDRRYSFETLSGNVGRTFPDIRDKLLNAIQLFSLRKDNKEQ